MRKLFTALTFMLSALLCHAQQYNPTEAAMPQGKTIVFRFIAEDDTFYIPYQGNGEKLSELITTIDYYKSAITNGQAKINVAGYCSSYATGKENLHSAGIRANRVKSELIVRCGIIEDNFATTVHATSYEGRKSVVVVMLRIPQIQPVPEKPTEQPKPQPKTEPIVEQPKVEPEPITEQPPIVDPVSTTSTKPYCFAVRTNLLYDAFLVPNLGIEWRASESFGIKVDAGGSRWGSETGNIQKTWYVNPELRYYMGGAKRFYVGVSGNYGEYNIYKGILGNMISKDTGYQGTMWNAGLTAGYQLPLYERLALNFNLGLGYNSFSYDTFTVTNEVRVYKDRDQTKSFFGPTQAGISLVWMLGK